MEKPNWPQWLQTVRNGPLVMILVLFGLVLLGLQVFRGTLTQRLPAQAAAPIPTHDVPQALQPQQPLESSAASALVPSAGAHHIVAHNAVEGQIAPAPPVLRQAYDAQRARDPFVGPWHKKAWADAEAQQHRVVEQPKPHAPPPVLTVQGIILGGAAPLAIVNNETVGQGDTIGGALVTRIEPDAVVVTFEGQELVYPAGGKADKLRQNQQKPWQSGPPVNSRPYF